MRRVITPNRFLASIAIVSSACIGIAAYVFSLKPGLITFEQRLLVSGSLYLLFFGIICPVVALMLKAIKQSRPVRIQYLNLPRRNLNPKPPSPPGPTVTSIRNIRWKPAQLVAHKPDAVRKVA
jgi:hypothetical protein